jgi:Fe-S-cluster containining protein
MQLFIEAREKYFQDHLLDRAGLERLREKIEAAYKGVDFCDGCGFCCVGDVPMSQDEFERIEAYIKLHPDAKAPQGLVCSFLDLNVVRFNQNLVKYGKTREPMQPSYCRVYPERPMICRMHPAPKGVRCRELQMLEVPNINDVLSESDFDEFPEQLIQRYYLTLNYERLRTPLHVLDPNNQYQLVPGWRIDEAGQRLILHKGPDWIHRHNLMPLAFPTPDECDLEPWALEVFTCLVNPCPLVKIVERFMPSVAPEALATLIAQAELAQIIVPIDFLQRLRPSPGYWAMKEREENLPKG